jgi:transcriptional regulator GlxA family with amidase domain
MKGGVKQWLNFGHDIAKESGVTLLPSGDAPAADLFASAQVLLVRSYLERARRRPPSPSHPQPYRAVEPVDPSIPPAASSMPAALRSAMGFIDARAADPIGLTEIATAAQLSPRALQATFRRHLGTTPLGYLRSVRLARVHADLLAARRGDGRTVSEIASRWGFTQLSRFASDYKMHYGQSPRQTLGQVQP